MAPSLLSPRGPKNATGAREGWWELIGICRVNYPADPEGMELGLGFFRSYNNDIPGMRNCQLHRQSIPAILGVCFWRIPAQVFPLWRSLREFQALTLKGQFLEVLAEQIFECRFSQVRIPVSNPPFPPSLPP